MNVKRRACILAGAAVVSLAVIVLLVLVGARSPAPAPTDPSSALPRYTIGEYNGRLAVYTDGQELPREVYDVYLATLPEEEQLRLRAGIPVEDDVQLQQLLEDYTS